MSELQETAEGAGQSGRTEASRTQIVEGDRATAAAWRILVVDDDAGSRELSEDILSTAGYRVVTAEDGQAAWELIQTNPIDLVLSDLFMPRMDGMGLLRAVGDMAEPPSVILMTAYSSLDSAVEATKLGAYGYMSKPVSVDRLCHLVGRALEERYLQRENRRLQRELARRKDLERERERQQLEIAAVVQQSFLPAHFPTCPRNRFQVDAKTIPASVLGGDLYDFPSQSDDWLALAIGDVSGKGVPAALFMAMLVSDLRFTALKFRSPGDVLRVVNAGLATRARRGMFVTMQYLLLDATTGAVSAANGGHVPLVWYHRRTGTAEPVELPGGPPLGILPEAAYPETTLALEQGDILLLLTDGVLESKNARGDAFGLSRLTEVMEAAGAQGRALLHPVLEAVEAFAGGRRQDDLTLVELRWG